MTELLSLIGGAYRLIIDVPVLGIGILVGGLGYRYLLLKNPALLQKLVDEVASVSQTIASDVSAAVASAPTQPTAPVQTEQVNK
jgi:hypothetical protein